MLVIHGIIKIMLEVTSGYDDRLKMDIHILQLFFMNTKRAISLGTLGNVSKSLLVKHLNTLNCKGKNSIY